MITLDSNWEKVRNKTTSAQTEGLERRMRGLLKGERRTVKASGDVSESDLLLMMDETSKQIAVLLGQFEVQAMARGYGDVMGDVLLPPALETVALRRAREVEEQFRASRWEHFSPKSMNFGLYERLIQAIAETEIYWAYGRGSVLAWLESGVEKFVTVRGGDCNGCCPGVNLSAVNLRGGLEGLPPHHAGCGCYVVPG